MSTRRWLLASAGLTLAPAIWAVNTQWGQVATHIDCGRGWRSNFFVSLTGAGIVLGAALASWRFGRAPAGSAESRSHPFMANVAMLSGVVFAYALLLQAMAGLLLSGCER